MGISIELKKEIRQGDYTQIARLLYEKNGKAISARYVSMILNGVRTNAKSDVASEIIVIARQFLDDRRLIKNRITGHL